MHDRLKDFDAKLIPGKGWQLVPRRSTWEKIEPWVMNAVICVGMICAIYTAALAGVLYFVKGISTP